ncbi:MAG: hypothetical protein WC763_00600 [Candidatus Paceibacterota bacterium]|jgi:hypothetical protein
MNELLQKICGKALRLTYSLMGMRPTSYPYISGDGFRSLAGHIHEAGRTFRPEDVRRGDIVFVESALIGTYFSTLHPRIENPYTLITHNGDANIGASEAARIDDKIIRWFAQNVLVKHPKLIPVPIGLENARHAGTGRASVMRRASQHIPKKNGRILAAFTAHTNPKARERALDELRANPLADIREGRMPQRDYLDTLKTYGYVASPPGNGEDCHRTWEALYVGTVPIVQPSVCVEYFRSLGIPVIITQSWKSIGKEQDEGIPISPKTLSPLFFDYWKGMITSKNHHHEER